MIRTELHLQQRDILKLGIKPNVTWASESSPPILEAGEVFLPIEKHLRENFEAFLREENQFVQNCLSLNIGNIRHDPRQES